MVCIKQIIRKTLMKQLADGLDIFNKSLCKVKIKEVSFTDNGKIVMEHKGFTEGKSEDGSVTKLNPLSTDFYLGDPPKKEHVYKLHITWEKKGQPKTDTFLLK